MSEARKPKELNELGEVDHAQPSTSAAASSNGFHQPEMLQQLISLFADTVPQSIWITDADGNVKFLNKHWYAYSGMDGLPATLAEIAAEAVHPGDAPALLAAFEEARLNGRGFEVEQRNRDAEGEYRWFLNRANPYRDPKTGEIALWFGVEIDIHDRKLAETALKESEERLRLVQAAGGIGSFDYDIQRDVAVCSPEYFALFGLPEGYPIGRETWTELIHPEDREAALKALDEAIAERKPFDHEYRIVRRDNAEIRWLAGRAAILFDGENKPWRFVGGNIDITEQRRVRDEERFFFEIAELIRTATEPETLLAEISTRLGRFLDLHRCLFNEIDLQADKETVHRDYSRDGESVAGEHKISIYSAEASVLMSEGRTIVNNDSQTDPRTAAYFETTYKPAKEIAYVAVPMLRNGRWVASLWCSDDRPRKWSNHEVALLENIAERAWAAVERIRSERSQRTFFELVESAPFGMYIVDADFRVATMNAGSQSGAFANVRPVIGRDFSEAMRILWPEPVAAEIVAHFRRTLETGETYVSRDFTHLRGDISKIESYEWELHRILMPDGRFGVVCYYYDSTRLREAERREREQVRRTLNATAKFEAVFNQSGFHAAITDLGGKVLEINDIAVEETGFSRADIIDRPYWEAGWWETSPDVAAIVRKAVETAAAGGTFHDTLEFRRSDGSPRVGELSIHPICDHKGEVIFLHPTMIDITERTRVEAELAQAALSLTRERERLDIALRVGGLGVYEWNIREERLWWSPELYPLFGVDPETFEPSVEAFSQLIHPDDRDELWRKSQECIDSGAVFDHVYRIVRPDGEVRWIRNQSSVGMDAAGAPERITGIGVDVTDAILSQERVRKSEAEYRVLFEAAGVGNAEVELPSGRFIRTNRKFQETLGYAADELGGLSFMDVTHPDDRERDLALIGPHFEGVGGGTFEVEKRFVRKDGRAVWVHLTGTLAEGEGGTTRLLVSAIDITARRDAEEKFRYQLQLTRGITESAAVSIFVSDRDGMVTYLNPEAEKVFGYTLDELAGRTLHEVIHSTYPDGRAFPPQECPLANVFKDGKPVFGYEGTFFRKDGSPVEILCSTTPILEDGAIVGEVMVMLDITERRRTEEKLRESEERFRNMADYAPVMVWVTDASGYCTYLSRSWYEFTGQTEEEGLGFGWLDATHPDDRDRAAEAFHRANESCGPFRVEYRLRRADGEYRWAIDSARPRFSEAGVFLGYVGSVIDITERKRMEEELRRSEEEFRTVTNAAPALVWVSDSSGQLIYFNERWYEYTGLGPEGSLGTAWAAAVPQEDLDVILPRWEHSQRTGEPYEGECRYRRADGQYRWHAFRALPRFDAEGAISGWYGVSVDVHEEKIVSERVKLSEERYRALTELSPQMVYMCRPDGSVTYVNQYTLEWTGATQGEFQNDDWLKRIHPDHRDRILNVWRTATALGSEFEVDVPFRYADGTYRTLYNRALPIKDEKGDVLYWIGTALDVEDRKRAEENLRESEQRFRHASDSAPVLIWMADESGDFVWFNKPWLDFTGHGMEQEIGRGWAEGIHPVDRERCLDIYAKSFEHRREFVLEFRLRRSDGEYRWMLSRAVPRSTADGTFLGFIGTCVDIHDRRTAESALRQSEARLQLATRIGNYGTWDLDFTNNRQVWSDKLFEIFGLKPTPDRVIEREMYEPLIFPEDLAKMHEINKDVRAKRGHFAAQYRIRRADTGETRWVDTAAHNFYDSGGNPTRVVGITQDITERRNIAERIRSSEAQLRLVTDSIPALVSYVDKEERYRFANRRYADWFGIESKNVVGRTLTEVLGQGARGQLEPLIRDVFRGETVSTEVWLDYEVGGRRFVHISYVPDFAESGDVQGFYALVTDLTAQKQSEEMLRSTEDRMRTISESFADYAIISTDAEGNVESWNLGAENIFGYVSEEMIGRRFDVLFTPEDVEAGVPQNELEQARRIGRCSDERWHMRKDGTRFYGSGVTAPLFVGDKLTGFAKICTDLTEKKRSAEALQRAYDEMENRVLERTRELASMNETLMREISERQTAERQKIELLKRLVSGQEEERRRIARDLHDHLGQRLTALRLKLASLREACADREELYARATRLQQIAELIDSEVSFLAWELRPSTLDELGLIDAISAFVKEWSKHYEIDAEFHSAGIGDVRLDREAETHLYRITQEALNNIYKHANARKVSVLVERAGDDVVLIVEDDGSGMPHSNSPRLTTGRGLGLAGMRERAELIGGSLEIESEIGKGTTIYVRISANANERTK